MGVINRDTGSLDYSSSVLLWDIDCGVSGYVF